MSARLLDMPLRMEYACTDEDSQHEENASENENDNSQHEYVRYRCRRCCMGLWNTEIGFHNHSRNNHLCRKAGFDIIRNEVLVSVNTTPTSNSTRPVKASVIVDDVESGRKSGEKTDTDAGISEVQTTIPTENENENIGAIDEGKKVKVVTRFLGEDGRE